MLNDMNPDRVVGPARTHTVTYHDGTSRTICVTDIETPFPDGKLIVSRTDPAGIITSMNPAFIEMSGYHETELLGAPHHILRHPDMPAVAFADLWDTVNRGNKWSGYVKNLRADGGFYWVYATVIPNIRHGQITGFTSVRRKPSRRAVEQCTTAYAALLV
ncbi:MAG: PAS domain-containing protein [Acidimicrobiia bacterium]